jgi:hypothetical protein
LQIWSEFDININTDTKIFAITDSDVDKVGSVAELRLPRQGSEAVHAHDKPRTVRSRLSIYHQLVAPQVLLTLRDRLTSLHFHNAATRVESTGGYIITQKDADPNSKTRFPVRRVAGANCAQI